MSERPGERRDQGERRPVTIPGLAEMKRRGQPIVMVTAYDFPSAQVAEEAGVDVVLVGDTAAMVVLGYDATTPVGMDEMTTMAAAVRRGLRTPLLIGDMPFGSYERSNEHAIENAQRFVREAGCAAVKLERGGPSVERARAIAGSGIPVMGHVGLTPQSASALGGFKTQGRTAESAAQIARDALPRRRARLLGGSGRGGGAQALPRAGEPRHGALGLVGPPERQRSGSTTRKRPIAGKSRVTRRFTRCTSRDDAHEGMRIPS